MQFPFFFDITQFHKPSIFWLGEKSLFVCNSFHCRAVMNSHRLSRQIQQLPAIPIRCMSSDSSAQKRVHVVWGAYGAIGSALCNVLHQVDVCNRP